ncbi:MAG: rhodanese-like domain-containing protein [Comamonadaceae bacterium]|nr:rhodanese-like domain-containing protein [Rubrivivax sp.]NLZ41044.1 rhodanese-like domain-containing protein [Comamonadaceae bacterium]
MLRFAMVAAAALLVAAPAAQAQGDAAYAVIQKAADAYLTSLAANDFFDITADDVHERMKSGKKDFVVVDVRVPKDKKYDLGHLPGALFIGVTDIAKPASLARLPKDKDIIVYCDTGQQQNKAVTALRLLGYRAYAMKWGYMAWKVAPPTGSTLDEISAAIANDYPIEK